MKNLMTLILLFAAIPTMAIADGGNIPDLESLEFVTEMTVTALDDVEEAIDETARKQIDLIDAFSGEVETFIVRLTAGGAHVAEVTNQWVKSPTPENEARVSRAVTQVAATGREASMALADLDDRIAPVVATCRRDLAAYMADAGRAKAAARATYVSCVEGLEASTDALLDARTALERRGAFDDADFTLSVEEEDLLFRQVVDFQELAMKESLFADFGQIVDAAIAVLDEADRNFQEIERMTGKLAYQASSYGRCFGSVGHVEGSKIRLKLIADAFGEVPGLTAEVASAFERMRGMSGTLMSVVNASAELPRMPSADGGDAHRTVSKNNLLDFFRHFVPEATTVASNEGVSP